MNFRKDDIDTQLRYCGDGPLGVYDQLNWKVRTGTDATDIMSKAVTVHESMHNELNNATVYGSLLQSYAYLAREETPHQAHYNNLLCTLVDRCRTAHEVYATWMSVALLSADANDQLYQQLLIDNEEYLNYYNCAARMVQEVPDLYLRRHVVSAMIYICFQSRLIIETAIADIVGFDPDLIDVNEFPDQRLNFIMHGCPHINWIDMLNEFAGTQQHNAWYDLLLDALAGEGNNSALSAEGNEENSAALITFLYNRLAENFETKGLPSLPYMDHLTYFKKLLPLIDRLAPFSKSSNPLEINTQPGDITRSTLRNFENETLLFTNRPLNCILLHPSNISSATKAQILNGVGDYPHILITGRTYFFMEEQYVFQEKEDAEWCRQHTGSFTAIRYAGNMAGQRIVVYVPFLEPAELEDFLKDKPVDIPVLSSITETARSQEGWWSNWQTFFETKPATTCLLLDISPLYYLEKIFSNVEMLLYGKANIKMEEGIKSVMLFEIRRSKETQAFIAAPCSEIYAAALNHYIETRFPGFENKIDVPNEHLQHLPTIISHVFREEHLHYYWSHKDWT